MTEKERVERESGCWSHNAAVVYADALDRCKWHLKEAVQMLEANKPHLAEKLMKEADLAMQSSHVAFNRANNEHWRILALVKEIRALRSGVGISYAEGDDPVGDGWRFKS